MSTRRGFPEPLPPEKGHGGPSDSSVERYPHPRGKTVEAHFTRAYTKKPPELLQVRGLQSKRQLPTLL